VLDAGVVEQGGRGRGLGGEGIAQGGDGVADAGEDGFVDGTTMLGGGVDAFAALEIEDAGGAGDGFAGGEEGGIGKITMGGNGKLSGGRVRRNSRGGRSEEIGWGIYGKPLLGAAGYRRETLGILIVILIGIVCGRGEGGPTGLTDALGWLHRVNNGLSCSRSFISVIINTPVVLRFAVWHHSLYVFFLSLFRSLFATL